MLGQLARICTPSCQVVKIGRKNARELRVFLTWQEHRATAMESCKATEK